MLEKLFSKLNFDAPDPRFELLETEKGAPNEGREGEAQKGGAFWRKSRAKTGGRRENGQSSERLSRSLDKNEQLFRALFSSKLNPDIIFRRFETGFGDEAVIIFMNGMADAASVSDFIIRPLMDAPERGADETRILERAVQIGEAEKSCDIGAIEAAILEGRTALFLDGRRKAILLETRGFEKRSVSTAENERIVRGPQEGFTESIRTNVTLVRRIVKTRDLIVSYRNAGGENGTKLALLYRKSIANPALLSELEGRIARIESALVSSSGDRKSVV